MPHRPSTTHSSALPAGVRREPFGAMPDGQVVERFTIVSPSGVSIAVLSYGGVIQSILLPDRRGELADVALGYDTLEEYRADRSYFGALVGRYANRIRGARFSLDGREYVLAANADGNQLHGGIRAFDKVVWSVEPMELHGDPALRLVHVSPDGDEGYPGTVQVEVVYAFTRDDALEVSYRAMTDAPTPINLTQHSYFNLAGAGAGDILGHELELAASRFTPVDAALIPTGELRRVAGTPFDFSTPERIGARIDVPDEQLRLAGGYDHNFVIDRAASSELVLAARLTHRESGRGVDVHTTQPAIQFYSGNFLDGSVRGKGGVPHRYRSGLALETQHFPDSPNHPAFPSTILRPGETFSSRTVYQFEVRPV